MVSCCVFVLLKSFGRLVLSSFKRIGRFAVSLLWNFANIFLRHLVLGSVELLLERVSVKLRQKNNAERKLLI